MSIITSAVPFPRLVGLQTLAMLHQSVCGKRSIYVIIIYVDGDRVVSMNVGHKPSTQLNVSQRKLP